MPKGGSGAGRPKGPKNKRTIAIEDTLVEGGELPKGFMLRVMRDESQPMPLRAEMAKAAAPYFHPRLNAIEQRDERGNSVRGICSRLAAINIREALAGHERLMPRLALIVSIP